MLFLYFFCYYKVLQNLIIISIIIIYLYYFFINFFFHILWCSGLFRNVPDLIDGRPKSLGQFWLHTI